MKKIVCQLVVKGVDTEYCVDSQGRLYSPNRVREGFDLRPVNGQVQHSGLMSYPVKRMNLECVLKAGLSKTANVHQEVFAKLFNKALASELEVDDFVFAPSNATVRVLVVNQIHTNIWIDKNGILYQTFRNKHQPIRPVYRNGSAYYPLNLIRDDNVHKLNFVKPCGQGFGLYVEDLIEYYKTVESHGLPDLSPKVTNNKSTNDQPNIKPIAKPKVQPTVDSKHSWIDNIPSNVELCIKIDDKFESFDNKQQMMDWLRMKFEPTDTTDVKVFVLGGSILVSPPEKINQLVF